MQMYATVKDLIYKFINFLNNDSFYLRISIYKKE